MTRGPIKDLINKVLRRKRTVTTTRTKSPTQYTQSTAIKSPQDEEESNYSYRTGVKKSVTTKSGKAKSKSISVRHKGQVYRRRLPSGAAGGIGSNEGAYKQTTKPKPVTKDTGPYNKRRPEYVQTKVKKSGKSVSKPVPQKKAKKFASKMAVKGAYTSSHKEAGGGSDFGGKKGESSGDWGSGKGKHSSKYNIHGKNPLYMWGPKYDKK
tara:strand:+ start:217 stop:843 length:627 start_codon:yes stop_codon:yes gene_type:complete